MDTYEGPPVGSIIHIRDSVMNTCVPAIVTKRPPVLEVKPRDMRPEGNLIWITAFSPTGRTDNSDAARRSRIAENHWHWPMDCPDAGH